MRAFGRMSARVIPPRSSSKESRHFLIVRKCVLITFARLVKAMQAGVRQAGLEEQLRGLVSRRVLLEQAVQVRQQPDPARRSPGRSWPTRARSANFADRSSAAVQVGQRLPIVPQPVHDPAANHPGVGRSRVQVDGRLGIVVRLGNWPAIK